METGRRTVSGEMVMVGDTVHCWDGEKDKSVIIVSITGCVGMCAEGDRTAFPVDRNTLVLYCADYVEIVKGG